MRCFFTVLCVLAGTVTGFAQQRAQSTTLRGIASRAYLGVGVVELTDDRGLEVKLVDQNSPAAKAGLKENDVILEVNGKGVEGNEQFSRLIGETSPGTKVSLTIRRNGAKQTVSATLGFYPFNEPDFLPDAPAPPMPAVPFNGVDPFQAIPGNSGTVGFEGEPLNQQLAEFFGVREGVLVRSVYMKTPAERAGLKAGDVVIKVNGTPVTTPREITGLVRSSRKKAFTFTIVRNKKEMTLNVEIAEDRSGSEREDL
jgi:serine protease Do